MRAGLAVTARSAASPCDGPSRLPGLAIRDRFPATPEQVREALLGMIGQLRQALPSCEPGTLEIVLAEVLNNVAEHAYAGRPTGQVEVLLDLRGGKADCRIRDQGAPLPPHLLHPPVAAEFPGSEDGELPEGGFGWQLIHALATGLSYERRGGSNLLTFSVALGPDQAG